jgi:hypothetical protein
MGDSLGDIAKSWLADPPWQRVFKHTFDVIVDYVTYILVAIGGVALSVRLLTTLSTGDLVLLCLLSNLHWIKKKNVLIVDLSLVTVGKFSC